MNNKTKMKGIVASSIIMSYLLVGGAAFAAGPSQWKGGRAPGLIGTVSAINGTTLTVTSKNFGPNATSATYAVDASSAVVSKNGDTSSLSNVNVGDTIMVVGKINGTDITATSIRDGIMMGRDNGRMMGRGHGVLGTVATVSGNTITVTSKVWRKNGAATTYTVDATNATVTKNDTSSSVSNILVGDTVSVLGTINGTNITAKSIRDGVGIGQRKMAMPVIQGNGLPVVGGSVTAINGSVLTVTNKSNVTYTVDATNATIVKAAATSTIGNVNVGDAVIVQGTVNGTSITASSVIDQAPGVAHAKKGRGFLSDFFDGIGGFFHHLFGF